MPQAAAETAVVSATASALPVPAQTPIQLANDKIHHAATLPAALAIAKPLMSDESDKLSDGTLLLALWAIKHGSFAEFSVIKPETTHQLVAKDSDAERGKRVCVAGSVVEIKKEKTPEGAIFVGEITAGDASIWHFTAAGSTGTLVGGSSARLCGVVIGKYDYTGSASNTVHATEIVGMFDLPENRAR